MSNQNDSQEAAHLDQVNEELTRSLMLCHSMVDDYRSKLAANASGGPDPANDDEPEDGGDEAPADAESRSA